MSRRTVLIAAADVSTRAAIARIVRAAGFGVELADGLRRAREVCAGSKIDLAIVAAGPVGSGAAWLARELNELVGKLIVVADRPTDIERFSGMFPGTVVARALSAEAELRARLRQQLLEPSAAERDPPPARLLRFEGCTLDLDGRTFADAGGRDVPLTDHEFKLLLELARHPGRVRSREQLRGALGGDDLEAYDRSIDMHVSRLRRKIEPEPRKPRLILTVPGAGYKFAGPVQRSQATAPAGQPRPPEAGRSAERRQLTVLSCAVDGVAGMAAEQETEALLGTVAGLRRASSDTVGRHGGCMASFLGDSMVAYFGWPEAHEDDAERAIRAGLDLVETIVGAAAGALHPRIGIACGPAVVGDLGLGGESGYAVIGERARLADRLRSAAPPDGVVIGPNVRALAGSLFECREIEPVHCDGFGEPVPAWQVVGPSPYAGRFAGRAQSRLTPLAGRGEELETLQQRWLQAQRGAGQVVLLAGDPGVGKSRLAFELQHRLGEPAVPRLWFFGSPHHTNSPLFVAVNHLERAAGFVHGDTAERKLSLLRDFAARIGVDPDPVLPVLAGLLSLPQGAAGFDALTPTLRKQRTFEVLEGLSARIAERRPALMVFEDVQWFDGQSLELLAREVERAPTLPVLLVITARPEFVPPWPDEAHVTRLSLTRLEPRHAALLARHAAGAGVLPASAIAGIVGRADGVPLFIEELTRMVVESRRSNDGRRRPTREVPGTLQGLLLARIDRLDPADKAVAQLGAVLGRTFSYELLRLLHGRGAARLEAALDRLTEAGILYRRGAPPQASYTFKHALMQDAAYSTLSRRRQRELHARAAQALEEAFPEIVAAQPELLAYHHAGAEAAEAAVPYHLKAAENALRAAAGSAAMAQISAGLRLIRPLPASPARDRLALPLYASRGTAFSLAKGYAARETGESYAAAARLVHAAEHPAEAMRVLFGSWVHLHVRGHTEEALAMAARVRAQAARYRDADASLVAASISGQAAFYNGRLQDAVDALDSVLQTAHDRETIAFYPIGFGVNALVGKSLAFWLFGRAEEAVDFAGRAEAEARAQNHPFSIGWVLLWGSAVHLLWGEPDRAQPRIEEGIAIAEQQGYSYLIALGRMVRGWLLGLQGEPRAAIDGIRRGFEAFEATGAAITNGFFRMLMAGYLLETGEREEALAALAAAVAQTERWGERWYEPELYRVEGDILAAAARPDREAVEAAYRRAIATARRQGAVAWERRAAASLAAWQERRRAATGPETVIKATARSPRRRRDGTSRRPHSEGCRSAADGERRRRRSV